MPAARNVIFISLDTTRPDHLGCYGNPWISTPHLDRLASESILFTQYMTVVPTTLPSHTSLFSGKYPHSHGNPQNGYLVNRDNLMLPEILHSADIETRILESACNQGAVNRETGLDIPWVDYMGMNNDNW
jgi:arylsulfatase A-like enzyme